MGGMYSRLDAQLKKAVKAAEPRIVRRPAQTPGMSR
jgi:hypothetical protein